MLFVSTTDQVLIKLMLLRCYTIKIITGSVLYLMKSGYFSNFENKYHKQTVDITLYWY